VLPSNPLRGPIMRRKAATKGNGLRTNVQAKNARQARPGDPASESSFLTVPEVSSLLRVPKSWLYEQTRQRTIPHLKPGKRRTFQNAQPRAVGVRPVAGCELQTRQDDPSDRSTQTRHLGKILRPIG